MGVLKEGWGWRVARDREVDDDEVWKDYLKGSKARRNKQGDH